NNTNNIGNIIAILKKFIKTLTKNISFFLKKYITSEIINIPILDKRKYPQIFNPICCKLCEFKMINNNKTI
ncbi:hypothetical protein, partial [Staphylococcus felis]|uniref:hypothetical protein n=1 Tax=Staphylococcus felis TaxID=46127 RepID=UPI001EE7A6B0